MKLLLDHGADPNAGGARCPLINAIQMAHTESVKLLLDRGARPGKVTNFIYPMFYAVQGTSRPAILQAMLDHGADANTRAEDGATPLMKAVAGNPFPPEPVYVKMLIAHGADVNARDHAGHTALSLALTDQAKYQNGFNLKLAARGRTPLNPKVAKIWTSMDQQAYARDTQIIAILKQAGAQR
jgi:ankyrin repeat protein